MALKSIRVRILGREYPLRIREGDEAMTRHMARYVNAKMEAFKQAHPEQSELTTAVITALGLAEELYEAREIESHSNTTLIADLDALADALDGALSPTPNDTAGSNGQATND